MTKRRLARSRVEIVKDIIFALRLPEEAAVLEGVGDSVNRFVEYARRLRQNQSLPSWGERKKVTREIEKALKAVVDLVDRHANDHLLEICWPSDGGELRNRLAGVRDRCARWRGVSFPRAKKVDLLKYWSAKYAYGVIAKLGKEPPKTTDGGQLQIMAGLFYEAATGKPEVHLKRFCDTAVEEDRSVAQTLSIIREIEETGVASPDKVAEELNKRGIGWPGGKWTSGDFAWSGFLVTNMGELAVERRDWNGAPVKS
jgi:hypothetical protein